MSGEATGSVEVRPGRSIAWTALGDGPPLVIFNGYAGTRLDWDPAFLGALAAHHRVICPDNAGLGDSPLPAGEAVGGVEGMTTDAVALFDALGLERAAVAGWSMGGFVAQSLIRQVPERIAAAALISTHTGGPDCVDAEAGVFQVLIDHSGTSREAATRFISLLFPPERAAEADAQFGEILAAGRAELPEPVLFEQEDAIVQWHGRTSLAAAHRPEHPDRRRPRGQGHRGPAGQRRGAGALPSRCPGRDPPRLRPRADGPGAGRRRRGDPGDDRRRVAPAGV